MEVMIGVSLVLMFIEVIAAIVTRCKRKGPGD